MLIWLNPLFKPLLEAGSFSDLLNVCLELGPSLFLLKTGEVMIVLQVEGQDAEGLEPTDLSATTATIQRALRAFDEDFTVAVHTLKRFAPSLPEVAVENPVAKEALNSRIRFLNKKATLYQYETYITATLRPEWTKPDLISRISYAFSNPIRGVKELYSVRRNVQALQAENVKTGSRLYRVAASFLDQTSDTLRGRVLTTREALQFFRKVVNPSPLKGALSLSSDGEIDFKIADSQVDVHAGHLIVDDYFVKILTLKSLSNRTHANILGTLPKITGEIRLVTEWHPVNAAKALADRNAL